MSASRPSFRGAGRPPRPPAAAALFSTTAPSSATTPLFPASTTDAASVLPLFAPSPVAPTTFAVGSPNRGVAGYYNAPLTPTASFTAPPAEYRTPQHVAGNSPHGSHGLEYAGPAAHFLPAAGQYVSPHARPRAHDAHPDVHAYAAPQDEASLIREAIDRPLSPMFHRMANAVTAEAKIAEFHSIETQRAKYEECIRIKRAALEAMEIQVAEAKSTVSALRVEMEADEQGVETYKCILLPFLRKMAFADGPMPSLNLLKSFLECLSA